MSFNSGGQVDSQLLVTIIKQLTENKTENDILSLQAGTF